MTALRKLSLFFIALVVLVGGLGLTPMAAQAATCTQYHTVKRGENLYSIGLLYNVSWKTLADWNSLANPRLIFVGQKLCVAVQGGTVPTVPPGTIPTISIVSVVKDTSVTIKTANFPANDSFNVLMGTFGTLGVNGTKVGTFNSGTGGTLTATFNIPAGLQGRQRLAIRLQSPTSGFFSYNWFWNNPSGSTGGGSQPPASGYTGFPTFSISSVVRDSKVTIYTNNFPANDTFTVRMGGYGTRAVGGVVVGTINSGQGGAMTLTFDVPAALMGSTRIAIRAESPTSGYFAYNWFWNNNAP